MTKKEEVLAPELPFLRAAPDVKPIELRSEMEARGLIGPHMKAKDLVDETFIIYAAKRCLSQKYPDSPYYFCNCTDAEHSEEWTTTLGGGAVVEMLDKYIAADIGKPIQVTLRFTEEGSYGGYYTIE